MFLAFFLLLTIYFCFRITLFCTLILILFCFSLRFCVSWFLSSQVLFARRCFRTRYTLSFWPRVPTWWLVMCSTPLWYFRRWMAQRIGWRMRQHYWARIGWMRHRVPAHLVIGVKRSRNAIKCNLCCWLLFSYSWWVIYCCFKNGFDCMKPLNEVFCCHSLLTKNFHSDLRHWTIQWGE